MWSNFVYPIKYQIILHDHEPERIAPVPSVILDHAMGVNLDPEVEDDQTPAEYPAEDVHWDRVIGWKVKIGPSETRVGDKVAGCQHANLTSPAEQSKGGNPGSLEEYDINQLSKHQPGIEFLRHILPLVPFTHFHL